MKTFIVVVLSLISSIVSAQQCVEQTVRLDYSGDDPARPTTRRVFELAVVRDQLLVSNGRDLHVYRGNRHVGGRRLVCAQGAGCQAPLPGDHDWTCGNMATCSACQYTVMSCWHPGSWLVDVDRPEDELIAVDTQTIGSATFARGSRQFILATGYAGGCGFAPRHQPTVWMVGNGRLIKVKAACLDFGTASKAETTRALPAWAAQLPELATKWFPDAGRAKSGGAKLEILNSAQLSPDRVLIVDSSNRLTDWALSGYGLDLIMTRQPGETPAAGSHFGRGFEVGHQNGLCLLVTSTLNTSALYSCDGPLRRLAWLNHQPGDGGIASLSPDAGFAYVAQSAGRPGHLYDISDPSNPRLIPGAGLTIPTPAQYAYQAHYDGEPYRGKLVLADYSMALNTETAGCDRTIFADGFESGDTSKWSATHE